MALCGRRAPPGVQDRIRTGVNGFAGRRLATRPLGRSGRAGAPGGTRTHTAFRPPGFGPGAAAVSHRSDERTCWPCVERVAGIEPAASGLEDRRPTTGALPARRSEMIRSSCPPRTRTSNIPVQNRAQLPIVLVGNAYRVFPRGAAVCSRQPAARLRPALVLAPQPANRPPGARHPGSPLLHLGRARLPRTPLPTEDSNLEDPGSEPGASTNSANGHCSCWSCAPPEGFEPPTSRLETGRAIRAPQGHPRRNRLVQPGGDRPHPS